MDFSRHPAVPEVRARCLRIARERGCSTRAARDVSAHRRDHAAADGYQSCDRRGRAQQDDGRDGSIGSTSCSRRVSWWAIVLPSPISQRQRCFRRWSGRLSFRTKLRLQFRSRSRKSGTRSRRIRRSDGLFRHIGSIAVNQQKSQLGRAPLGSKRMRARPRRPPASSRSHPATAPVQDRNRDSTAPKRCGDSGSDPGSGRAPARGRWA